MILLRICYQVLYIIATFLLRMYNLISFVSRGKIRKKVLFNLNKPLTPTQLSEKIKTHRSTTSRTLLELKERGLVKCITPNENMGRFYKITQQGKKIIDNIK
jgi:DNA-binding MarR family transcriptional regulator